MTVRASARENEGFFDGKDTAIFLLVQKESVEGEKNIGRLMKRLLKLALAQHHLSSGGRGC